MNLGKCPNKIFVPSSEVKTSSRESLTSFTKEKFVQVLRLIKRIPSVLRSSGEPFEHLTIRYIQNSVTFSKTIVKNEQSAICRKALKTERIFGKKNRLSTG